MYKAMSICYGLRLTPCQIDPSANPMKFIYLFKDLIRQYNLIDYALGFEKLNKYGEPTKPHFHFNFLCDAEKATIQTYIRRFEMFVIKGKTMYALSRHPEPDDFNRWFRYVAKEHLLRKYCKGFSEKELDEMVLLATDERKRSIAFNLEKRTFLLQKQTLFDRFSNKIDKLLQSNSADISGNNNVMVDVYSYRNIWIHFLKLYIKEKNAINPQTIKGYTNLYLLTRQLITPTQFFEKNNPSLKSVSG